MEESEKMENIVEMIERAAKDILDGFEWEPTVQGFDYWDNVYNNLRVLANEAKKQQRVDFLGDGRSSLGLRPGLYHIYWKGDGSGHSLAAVGLLDDGTRWFAPCNWTSETVAGIASTDWSLVESVVRVSLIEEEECDG
jgi:hypothetical protein